MSETMWWKVGGGFRGHPEPVRVVKETEKTLTILAPGWGGAYVEERRVNKAGSWERYFPTEEEAAGWLIERARDRVATARRALEQANGALGNLKGKYPNHPAFRTPEATR